jgi:N-methylhydantoinase B
VTRERAQEVYGVSVTETLEIDREATARLRAK